MKEVLKPYSDHSVGQIYIWWKMCVTQASSGSYYRSCMQWSLKYHLINQLWIDWSWLCFSVYCSWSVVAVTAQVIGWLHRTTKNIYNILTPAVVIQIRMVAPSLPLTRRYVHTCLYIYLTLQLHRKCAPFSGYFHNKLS